MRKTERDVELTGQFRRDWKQLKRGRYAQALDQDFSTLLSLLRSDAILPDRYHDHQLGSEWKDCRDCHLKPDLVLIYLKPDDDTVRLIRLGSHSQLIL